MSDTCEQCKHWKKQKQGNQVMMNNEGKAIGACLRYPPTHVDNVGWTHPLLASDRVCGEFNKSLVVVPANNAP